MSAWQPIKTMPATGCFLIAMDGSPYVVWWAVMRTLTGYENQLTNDQGGGFKPDFWMPIPEIPAKAE